MDTIANNSPMRASTDTTVAPATVGGWDSEHERLYRLCAALHGSKAERTGTTLVAFAGPVAAH